MKEGWTYKKLGEVCDILDYLRKPITKDKREPGDIPYYGATGCLDFVKDYIFDEKLVLLGEDGAKWGAGDNSSYIINGKTWVNNHAHALRPKREIMIDELLVYYLNYSNLQPFITGVTVPKLNQEKMRSIEIPVPPISEQRSIVSRFDAAFVGIDALKANAERQLAEARALFNRALTEEMSPKEGWEERTLGEMATDMYRGSGIKRDQITKEGTPCVRYGEIYTTYNVSFDKCVSHTNEAFISSRKYFEQGDLLFAITGESVEDIGKTIAYLGKDKCLLGGDIICMKHNQNAKYLSYALSTPDAIRQKGIGKTKLKVVHTNAPALKAIKVPVPSLEEQDQIASRLDALSANVRKLEEVQRKTLAECDALKQAMLKEVFE